MIQNNNTILTLLPILTLLLFLTINFPPPSLACCTPTSCGAEITCSIALLPSGDCSSGCTSSSQCIYPVCCMAYKNLTLPSTMNPGNCPLGVQAGYTSSYSCAPTCKTGLAPVSNVALSVNCVSDAVGWTVSGSCTPCLSTPSLPSHSVPLNPNCSSLLANPPVNESISCGLSCESGYGPLQNIPLSVKCSSNGWNVTGSCTSECLDYPITYIPNANQPGDCLVNQAFGYQCNPQCNIGYTPSQSIPISATCTSTGWQTSGSCTPCANCAPCNSPPIIPFGNVSSCKLGQPFGYYCFVPTECLVDGNFTEVTVVATCTSLGWVVSGSCVNGVTPKLITRSPDSIRVQIPSTFVLTGNGFTNNFVCVLGFGIVNHNYSFIPSSITSTTIECEMTWPEAVYGLFGFSIAVADISFSPSLTSNPLPVTLLGPCPADTYLNSDDNTCHNCPIFSESPGTGSTSISTCVCKISFYYNSNNNICSPCKIGMTCPGGNRIVINSGYWRASNHSFDIVSCPGGILACSSSSSSSSSSYLNPYCSVGYNGPACGVCEDGYNSNGMFQCTPCLSPAVNVFVSLLSFALALLFIYILLQKHATNGRSSNSSTSDKLNVNLKVKETNPESSNNNDNNFDGENGNDNGNAKDHESETDQLGTITKVALNYFQGLFYLGSVSANWSRAAKSFFFVSGQSSLTLNFLSMNCAFKMSYYTKLTLIYFIPLIVTCIVLITYGILHFVWRRNFIKAKDEMQLTLMLLLSLFHPYLFQESISIFPCDAIAGTNTSYLHADYSVDCSTSTYQVYRSMSIAFILLYIVGALVFLLYKLRQTAKSGLLFSLQSSAHIKYGYFIQGYRKETCYFELVIMARKMMIVLLAATMPNASMQVLTCLVLLTISMIVNIQMMPFKSVFVNRLEMSSLICLYITSIFAGFFLFLNANTNSLWISILLFLVNGIFSVFIISIILRSSIFQLYHYAIKRFNFSSSSSTSSSSSSMTNTMSMNEVLLKDQQQEFGNDH